MRRLLFHVILCFLLVLLAGCSKSDKKTKNSQMETALLKAATVEISSMFSTIRTYQMTYKAENGVYRECYPSPPGGGTDAAPDVWVDAGGFEDIGFRPGGSVRHQYAVTVSDNGGSFKITATGDLDEDGIKAIYSATSGNPKPKKEPANEY